MSIPNSNEKPKAHMEFQKHSFIGKPFKDQLEQLDK